MINYEMPILNKHGKPLRILMSANHACIRVMKEMRALKKVGYQIDGLANRVSYGSNDFDTLSVFQNERQFKTFLQENKNRYDIITYANEPDHIVRWIKEAIGDKIPLIVDLHDLDSIRRGFITKEERFIFNVAEGLIYVAKPIQRITNELHNYKKPNIVLYSYCNDKIVDYDPNLIKDRKSLVYEGGANPPDDKPQNTFFAYRDIYTIIKRIVDMGNETHMFCGNMTAYDTFQATGAVLYPPTEYDKMMQELTKFKYGLIIFNNHDGTKDQVNLTLTNKMFEYMACGLPSLACWCPETEKFIKKHKIGFTFDNINKIGDTSQLEKDYLGIMDNIKTKRKELVMENYIWKLENLFAEVLHVEKKGIPANIKKLAEFEYGKEAINKSLDNNKR